MNEIQLKEFIVKARKLWQVLSNRQKIIFLHYCADRTDSINRWDRMIPHPMTDFDTFFQSYSPSELDVIFHNSELKSDKPFTQEALYFVYDKLLRQLTPVYKPEEALSVVFEKMVREVGVTTMLGYLNEAFPFFPSLDKGLFLVLKREQLETIRTWLENENNVVIAVSPLADGPMHVEIETNGFIEDGNEVGGRD